MATGALYGEILDAQANAFVLTGATVSLDILSDVLTNKAYPDGTYLVDCPPGDQYCLTVTAPKYKDGYFVNIVVTPNTFTHFTVWLDQVAVPHVGGYIVPPHHDYPKSKLDAILKQAGITRRAEALTEARHIVPVLRKPTR